MCIELGCGISSSSSMLLDILEGFMTEQGVQLRLHSPMMGKLVNRLSRMTGKSG
jgi:hypothetical protein